MRKPRKFGGFVSRLSFGVTSSNCDGVGSIILLLLELQNVTDLKVTQEVLGKETDDINCTGCNVESVKAIMKGSQADFKCGVGRDWKGVIA